jgi:deazaflavin-dependent oxidoreductase (nitroreductase family)
MRLSQNNPVVRLTRWIILRKGMQRRMAPMIRYGVCPFLYIYQLTGIKVLLLTTTGRKTGKPRTFPIVYIKQGQEIIISAHQAGHDRHPAWYLNLIASPRVTVELFWRRRPYQAEPVTDEAERKALLAQFPLGLVEAFQEYTTRSIPVIRLRPADPSPEQS